MTINATMINDQADRIITGQRAKFRRRFVGKGASRDLSMLFTHENNPFSNPEASFTETKDMFLKKLYTDGIKPNQDFHPDFPEGYESSNYSYSGAIGLLESVNSKSDSPNKKGPNLKVLSIDDNGSPIFTDDHDQIAPDGGETGFSRGFGTNFEHVNEENLVNPYTISYIERKDSDDPQAVPRLGEYINISKYLTDPPE